MRIDQIDWERSKLGLECYRKLVLRERKECRGLRRRLGRERPLVLFRTFQ
jgi:hypothetical protein